MSKIGTLIKIATVAGPAIVKVVHAYGPQLKKLAAENPEVFAVIKQRVAAIAPSKKGGAASPHAISSKINILRDQVTYLYASANSPAVAQQASAWRNELDALSSLLPVVEVMSKSARKNEIKALQKRIDALSAAILAATIGDEIEDAEAVVDYPFSSTQSQGECSSQGEENCGHTSY